MTDLARMFLILGALFIIGLITDLIGKNTPLPRVSMLLLFGFLIGPAVFDLLPNISHEWFPIVADMALVMIGFLLGGKLTISFFRKSGHYVVWISLMDVFITALVVVTGLLLFGLSLPAALLLAAIAPATAPASTIDVIQEVRAEGPFTNILYGIVGLDDVWGLILFTLLLSVTMAILGGNGIPEIVAQGAWDIGGAILLGMFLGCPMAYLTGRIQQGEPTLIEALGIVFLCGGIALWLEVSFLLAAMVMGAVVANLAKHHKRPFHAIEGIEWPFLVLFFTLAGASIQIRALVSAGYLLLMYVCLRVLGRLIGATLGGFFSRADPIVRSRMWMALMPQAGVAVGMALYAFQRFPEYGDVILPVILGGTVIFELLGPVLTRHVIESAGEAKL